MFRAKNSGWASALVSFQVVVVALGMGWPAFAAQPPMTAREIDDNSDAIAVIDVLGIVCQEDHGGGTRRYQAWVQIREVIKGDLRVNDTLLLPFTTIGRQAGGIHVVLHAGERVRVSLNGEIVWHQDGYRVLRRSSTNSMPTRPGEVSLSGLSTGRR